MTEADGGLGTDDIFNVRTGEPGTFDRSGFANDAKRSESALRSPLTQGGLQPATAVGFKEKQI